VEIEDAVHNVLGSLGTGSGNTVLLDDLSRYWISQGGWVVVVGSSDIIIYIYM
jgi:hypothetical protein